jgi:hypothetical protein
MEFFTKIQHDLASYDFSVSHNFDTIEVIEAELQAVLNIITEYDFQDAYKK